jgi:hypothetical protein
MGRIWSRGAASLFVAGLAVPAALAGGVGTGTAVAAATSSSSTPTHIDCGNGGRFLCTELADSDDAFGHYVGHDEPSVLFYSNTPGSGHQMSYTGQLPVEPTPTNVPGKHVYTFEYTPAFWFGMAMCDSQSYPELVNSCTPDSDQNAVDPAKSPYHPGTAFMELQFYPPGYVQQWNGFSCSPTQWCVALTIDSYSKDSLTGQSLNATCQAKVGIEYVNFAYLTKSGVPQGPPNPVQFDPIASGTPNPSKVLFLNQGDTFSIQLHDTQHGLQAVVKDATTGATGSMTASAANGFGQVKFAPKGTSCTDIPYDFHPMYSTSTPSTTVPWAAATYNIAMDTELGHFDYCSKVDTKTASCTGYEGVGVNREPADSDDIGCWPPSASGLIKIGGCEFDNLGYDGPSYLRDWPDGSSSRPTPFFFTSPLTGPGYNVNYSQVAFNTDLPAIEAGILGTCKSSTGKGCTIIPPTDDGKLAAFYPYYTIGTSSALGGCAWTVGGTYPGFSTRDFGAHGQYGHLLAVAYVKPGGGVKYEYNDYQHILSDNPCPS